MTPNEIRFGTDGWRAVIADDYTFDNVRAVSQAMADYLKRHGETKEVVIGYDTRFLSGSFAGAVAEVMVANDIPVALTSSFVPTPALSFAVRERGASAGVMITASHNPARWNGFKIKSAQGGTASPEVTSEIEQGIPGVIAGDRVKYMPLGEAEAKGLVERIDAETSYLKAIRDFVDIDAIRDSSLNVLVDSMFGSAQGWTVAAIGEGAVHVREIRARRNPGFPGMRAPEPIAANLGESMQRIAEGGFDIGLSTDGDGDRFGLIDEQGRFITQLQTFALLVYYQLAVREQRGPIVRSVTMTRMVDKLGEHFGCEVYETPVGFKYLGPKMIETDALIAGEESGGSAVRGHIPERDGLLAGLFMLDFVARTGKKPSQLLEELYDLVGRHEYDRVDVTVRGDEKDAILKRVAEARPKKIAGLPVIGQDELDGFRFTLEGGWWLLLRFSGTEPLLRIYAEMPSMDQVQQALQDGQELAGVAL
ncbi:MAG: phosphoglucomutase/phosphomannomutase family protein [Chloroflexi bacterium]|nr:phosphoglucomutase/phosphomannomutase family protein [Chloroflexota bacterium]MDA1145465.1 phosphoglucomutase/phosphomannomutase family protein [Chloroflexota bacterium]